MAEEQVQSRRFQLGWRVKGRALIIEMQTGWIDDISPDRVYLSRGEEGHSPVVIDAVVHGIRSGWSRD